MKICVLILAIFFSFFFSFGCDSSEGNETDNESSVLNCKTLSDCPRGYICGDNFYCVPGDETEGNPLYEEDIDDDVTEIITDSNDGSCKTSSDCDADKICQYKQCLNPFDKIWRLSDMKVSLSTDKIWDEIGLGGEAVQPDPMIIVYLNGAKVLETDVASDTFTATFIESVELVLDENDSFVIEIRDADTFDYTKAGTITYSPVPISVFRNQAINETDFSNVISFSAKFEPAN